MKKLTVFIIGSVTIFVATAVLSQSQTNSAPPAAPAGKSPTTNTVLGVEQFMKNVDHYRGDVRVEGVVFAVSATNQMIGLIDVREYQTCGLKECSLSLPVRWTGALPAVGEAVRVDGNVQTKRGKLSFVAHTLEKVSLPPKGKE